MLGATHGRMGIRVGIFLLLISCTSEEFLSHDPVNTPEQGLQPVLDSLEQVPILPQAPYSYQALPLPDFMHQEAVVGAFVQMSIDAEDNLPPYNPITHDGATLGRVLFHDTQLSANGQVSCASCHQQEKGFSDPRKFSKGFQGESTRRHSLSLVNSRYYRNGRFFWDERASSLEEQVLMPFTDPIEMGLTEPQLLEQVRSLPYYPTLFAKAFGDTQISTQRISFALAQFVRSIVSYRSKYDVGRAQVSSVVEDFPNFNESENLGKHIFFTPRSEGFACFECHATEAFVGTHLGPQNNGLDATYQPDQGAFETYPTRPDLKGSFKVPTLRNIAVSAPYMHDGRFRTLMDVINHYNEGVQAHPQLSSFMKNANGEPFQLGLSEKEKQALVDFLHTLTDPELNQDPKYSDPFP